MPDRDEALRSVLRRPRYEVLPLASTLERVQAHVPRSVPLTVTASPGRGLEATIDAVERFSRDGYEVVPHLAARLVPSERVLKVTIERLADVGVRDVFVVGGDATEPVGAFADGLSLLEAMVAIGHPFEEVGIPGYPESHPLIEDDVLVQAMWDKRRYATYIVSQVCFRASPILSWLGRIRARGVELPVHVGVPGIARKRKLLRIARRIGVGESGRFLRRHKSWVLRLGLPGGYSPKRLLSGLYPALEDPALLGVAGLHVFTFNELESTEKWRRRTLERIRGDGSTDQRGTP